jgi:hypothetical protein
VKSFFWNKSQFAASNYRSWRSADKKFAGGGKSKSKQKL